MCKINKVKSHITEQTHRPEYSTGRSPNHFTCGNNSILGKLENGVDGSLFADNLAINFTTRNQRVATRELQGVITHLDA